LAPKGENLNKQSLRWTGILFGGVLLLLLAVLAATTVKRVAQTRELMIESLNHHGALIVTSLEGAARAGMRHGMWKLRLLQALTEEMSAHSHVRAVLVLDEQGNVMAAGGKVDKEGDSDLTVKSLPADVMTKVRHGLPVNRFGEHELVVGRPFDPWRHLRGPQPDGPPWPPPGPMHGPGPRSGPGPLPGFDRGPNPSLEKKQRRQSPGRNMMDPDRDRANRGMGMMRRGRSPAPEFFNRFQKGYALVRLSTADFEESQSRDLQQAVILAGLIFLAGAVAAAGLVAVARRRSREVEKLRKEMADVEHLAAVGRLAASVAHEVRNPLSAIRGMVQYLGKHAEPDSKQAEYTRVTISEVDRLARVVSSLLEYTRPRPPRRVAMDLGESLNRVTGLLRDEPLAKGVEIKLEAPSDMPPITADPDQIGQVLLNLTLNALQAMNGEGKLLLSASLNGNQARLVVEDSGPGLPEGDPDQVFDPFFSTKEMGTGLGLAIARRLVEAHGGRLTAGKSEMGGAKFSVQLPLEAK
jgi:two-component system sensor histidine kinase HydH